MDHSWLSLNIRIQTHTHQLQNIHNNFGVTNRIRRARGILQEGIRTLGQPEDFKLSSVHLHLTEGSPSACLRLLDDWIRTIDLQIYLGEKLL
ncbi:hypothetical protein ILYODFUR_015391 [Ilyodon furcidens]|uniref:Uncharacterized protein n=1 Tax=Ilyodon furcidens TaxID=33524 RepID=A0ABV0T0Z6_9TELE